MTKTAIIILDYRDHKNAERLMKALNQYRVIDRVVLADNSGEGEDSYPFPVFAKIDVIRLDNDGYARGNNQAIAYLEKHYDMFDYIIISNPDIEVEEQAITDCVDFLENHPGYAVAAPRMFIPDGQPHHLAAWKERSLLCDLAYSSGVLSRTIGMYRETYPPNYFETPYSEVDCVAGSFFVIKHSVFKESGYFDPKTFLYYEEDILGVKLKRAGYKEAVLNTCRFTHYESVSVNLNVNLLKKYLWMQKSRIYYQKKYRRINLLQLFSLYAATALGTVEKSLKLLLHRLRH